MDLRSEAEKKEIIFSNPALLKVIKMQCDLFSLGEIKIFQNEKEIPNDPLFNLLNNPNPFQTKKQILWDYMFWLMTGNAKLYVENKKTDNTNSLYFLDNSKIEYPEAMKFAADKIILSKKKADEYKDFSVKYRYADGTKIQIKNRNIISFTDLTNGTGNWHKGNSTIDALHKILSNSELALDSKNINLLMSKKFMVSGKTDIADVNKPMMGNSEKTDIERKVTSGKNVHAVRSMIDIKRFVENIDHLKLNDAYLNDLFLIGNIYNIPRDVMEAYESSTYENQEKARSAHVDYTLRPKGEDFCNALENFFDGYEDKNITMSWDHLPFNHFSEHERIKAEKDRAKAFADMVKSGIPVEDAKKHLGYEF